MYYKAFQTADNPLNRGELTFFVNHMLELIRIAQTGVIEGIELRRSAFERASARMDELVKSFELSEKETDIVFVLTQFELFGMFGSASLDELAENIRLGKQMTRKHLTALENKGVVLKTARRPVAFALTQDVKSLVAIEETKEAER